MTQGHRSIPQPEMITKEQGPADISHLCLPQMWPQPCETFPEAPNSSPRVQNSWGLNCTGINKQTKTEGIGEMWVGPRCVSRQKGKLWKSREGQSQGLVRHRAEYRVHDIERPKE